MVKMYFSQLEKLYFQPSYLFQLYFMPSSCSPIPYHQISNNSVYSLHPLNTEIMLYISLSSFSLEFQIHIFQSLLVC